MFDDLLRRIDEHLSTLPPRDNDSDTAWFLREARDKMREYNSYAELIQESARLLKTKQQSGEPGGD